MRKVIVLAAVAVLLAPAFSDAKTLDELLVEKGVITQQEVSAAGIPKVYWKKGTRVELPDQGFTMGITTEIQTRYTFTDNDGEEPNTSSFDIKRARLTIAGTALNKEFSYKLQPDFSGSTPQLKDAFLQWHTTECTALKMGQFKPLISRQYNTSKTVLQFPDRSIASEVNTIDRQPGAEGAMDLLENKALRLSAQVFNGESTGEGTNKPGVDTRMTGVLAARWAALGVMDPYIEGDVGYTEDLALNAGAAYAYSDAEQVDVEEDVEFALKDTRQRVSVDLSAKMMGWSANGEVYWMNVDPDSDALEESDMVSFYLQTGYFLMPKKLEVALRYSYVDCDDGKAIEGDCVGNQSLDGVDVSVNYYFWEHYLKAQLAWEYLREDAADKIVDEDVNTSKWMLQLSAMF